MKEMVILSLENIANLAGQSQGDKKGRKIGK
jgi:hypothetical protein